MLVGITLNMSLGIGYTNLTSAIALTNNNRVGPIKGNFNNNLN